MADYIPIAGSAYNVIGIVPFKYANKTYGGFSNTTSCNPDQYPVVQTAYQDGTTLPQILQNVSGGIRWKSSENAYHGQKLLHYHQKLTEKNPNDPKLKVLNQMIKELTNMPIDLNRHVFLPRDHNDLSNTETYDKLIEKYMIQLGILDLTGFNQACGVPRNNDSYMEFVVDLKLKQHTDLMAQAKSFAEQGIMPIEVSRHDARWASGSDGQGENKLGLIILKLGSKYLEQQDNKASKISDPDKAYTDLKKIYILSHDNLVTKANALNVWQNLSPPLLKSDYFSSSQSSPIINQNSAKGRVLQKILGASDLTVEDDHDVSKSGQKILKIYFNDPRAASEFAKSVGNPPSFKSGDKTVILGPSRTRLFLENKDIVLHGKTNPKPMMAALQWEQDKSHHEQSKRPR